MVEKKKSPPLNPYRWMTTYTDMVTLLLTFFILLIAMSTVSKEKKLSALSSVSGAFGNKPGGQSVIGSPQGKNTTVRTVPLINEEMDYEKLMNVTSRNALQSEISIVKEEERIIISLNNRLLFKPRSSRIDPDRLRILMELREVLKGSLSRIELRGYTDPSETVMDPDRVKLAAMLSTMRAFSLFHFLTADGEIPPERVVAHGFGNVPVARGQKDAHQQNRQVLIILDYREKLPYRVTKGSRNSMFDFKGFLFRVPGGEKSGE